VQLALLGPLEVTSGHSRVALSAPKERAVLEMLALRAGRPVPAEQLHEGLWGQNAPPSAARALHTYISHLRRALLAGCIVTTSGGYVLQVGPDEVDATRFEHAVHEARERQESGDRRWAVSVLREGLGLWRGRPCPELSEHSWVTAEVARLEELRREAEEELAALRLAMGESTRLVGELEAAVAAEPLRERRWAQLMVAYYRAGRQADALRAFARLRSTLADELGVSPSADLVALEQKVLQHSPELDPRPLGGEAATSHVQEGGARPLPSLASSFVGRAGQVAEVAGLVGERRLVTLAGTGGCGKTRLAQEIAATVAGRFAGGAHFVALAAVADPGLVPVAVAEALGVRPESGRPPAQVVAEVIGHRETLAVVDNCEHLAQAVAELVERLLSDAPGLRVLATSREPLRIAGETVWRVPSLEVPTPGASAVERRGCAAVELFVDRVLSARPGLRLDDDAIATVAEIVRRLDGMPLAIELAAARVGLVGLAGILERLDDRFALLSGGSRTAPSRQQTLRAAVAWSYDLLSAKEKDLFCDLSAFRGSFSLEAALAVAGTPPEEATEDFLALVSKSMVAIVGPVRGPLRYRLHETLRHFGAGQVGEANLERARDAHACYYLSLVGSGGPEPFGAVLTSWLKSIESDLDNLRAVFSYLAARPGRRDDLLHALVVLRRYWLLYGRRREGLVLLEDALSGTSAEADDPSLRAKALVTAASVAQSLDAEACARYANAGGELAARVGDTSSAALAAAVAAQANGLAGRYDEDEGDRALQLARKTQDPLLVCEGLKAVELSTPDVGLAGPSDMARHRAALEELLAIAETYGDAGFSLQAHGNLCLFPLLDDDPEGAWPHIEQQMELVAELGLQSPFVDHRLASLLHYEGDCRASLALQRSCFEQARREDLSMLMGDVASAAANCVLKLGSDNTAAALLYGFAAYELETGGFGQRIRGYSEADADSELLRARLGDRLPGVLAEGAQMTREQVSELLNGLEKTAPVAPARPCRAASGPRGQDGG
jgi:predicted ATPase/DNA-binding SARP family transcriptional activator